MAFGLFNDTLSDCTFDFGSEIDNYHGPYRYFQAESGDLDYYFVGGPSIANVVRRFTWMSGRPALLPRWSISYSGSTMSYTDAPNAQEQLSDFLAKCSEYHVPCRSFHLSSGYTSRNDKRYVFTWNADKFPDPRACVAQFRQRGVRFCANIKPCLLQSHPDLEEARAAQLLLSTSDGQPAWVQFWSDVGAYVDFTQPAAVVWWKAKVTSALLEYGISSTWNDNNEYEVWSPSVRAFGCGLRALPDEHFPLEARATRALQPLLMMRASREAQIEYAPHLRPFIVSRSGMTGMHRYVQTWSGDNYTSWRSLKYNIAMGVGLALSGVSNSGHDVGGFAGPRPDRELFVRWVQAGIFMPRFSIHSWNDDASVNEPWMYDDCIGSVRALMQLREHLVAYIYTLLWRYHTEYEPVTRPTFHDFPLDAQCYSHCDTELLLGQWLLVAPVLKPGATTRTVYLPQHNVRWFDFWSTAETFQGATTIERPCHDWERPVLLVREGAIIPFDIPYRSLSTCSSAAGDHDASGEYLRFLVFPMLHGSSQGDFFDDVEHDHDGEHSSVSNNARHWLLSMRCDAQLIAIDMQVTTGSTPGATRFRFKIPANDTRLVTVTYNRSQSPLAVVEDRVGDACWRALRGTVP
jgi:alpha-glucosidase